VFVTRASKTRVCAPLAMSLLKELTGVRRPYKFLVSVHSVQGLPARREKGEQR
jgi:hypothetical protein